MTENKNQWGMSVRTRYLLAAVLVCSALLLGAVASVQAATDLSDVIAVGSNPNQVSLFDFSQPTVAATAIPQPIPTFVNPTDVAICSDGSKAVSGQTLAPNRVTTGYLFVFDPAATPPTATTVNLGSYSPQQIAIDLTGSRVAIGNNYGNTIKIVDLNTLDVLQTVTLVQKDGTVSINDRPRAVGYTRDGRLVVGVYGPVVGNYMNVFGATADGLVDGNPLKTIDIPASPSMLAIAPNDRYAVISSLDGDTVTVVDLVSYEAVVVPNINDPGEPGITADGKYALVPNTNSNTVAVIDLETRTTLVAPISVHKDSWGIGSARSVAVINGNEALVAGSGGVARIIGLASLPDTSQVQIEQVFGGAIDRIAVAPWPDPIPPDGAGVNEAPSAKFSFSPPEPTVLDTVQFTDESSDMDGDGTITGWSWDFGDGVTSSEQSPAHTFGVAGTYDVTLTVTDNAGGTDSETVRIEVLPPAPVANAGGPYTGIEGAVVTLSAIDSTGTDVVAYEWDFDGDDQYDDGAGQSATMPLIDGPATATIGLCVTDSYGRQDTATTTVTIGNAPPVVAAVTVPVTPVAVGTQISATASFADAWTEDTHTATWNWGDGTATDGFISGGSVAGMHTYSSAGIYQVTVTVIDDDGGEGLASAQGLVVYDPSDGFVTGGGWIDSPTNTYVLDPTRTGKATFGFVSKYHKGMTTPKGQTEFTFKAADLTFRSESYDWLVVTGTTAELRGTGMFNGASGYGMTLTAVDNGHADALRFRITDPTGSEVYSSGMQPLGGGSIVIHGSK